MKFLRRLAHVLSILALTVGCALAQPRKQQDAQGKAASDNQGTPQTPIQITVAAPEKSPAEKAKDDEQREREVVAQETIAKLTKVLATLAGLQAIITGFALGAAIRAANAAKRSADAANDSVRLVRTNTAIALAQKRVGDKQTRLMALNHQQWLHVSRFTVKLDRSRLLGTIDQIVNGPHDPVWHLTFRISNSTPLKFDVEKIQVRLNGSTYEHWNRRTVGPGTHYTERFEIKNVVEDSYAAAYDKMLNGVAVLLVGRVHYINALGERDAREFGRRGFGQETDTLTLEEIPSDFSRFLAVMDRELADQG